MEDRRKSLKRRIADEITRFEADQMRVRPEGVMVEISDEKVVVTMRGVACRAEKEFARDSEARALLDRFHNDVFDAAKDALERAVADILGRRVLRSRLAVDAESGTGIITFSLDQPGEN